MTDIQKEEAPNNPLISVPVQGQHYGWVEIAGAINQGAFAVLLSEVLVLIVVKRFLSEAVFKVKDFLDSIEKTSNQNAELIKELINEQRRKKDDDKL